MNIIRSECSLHTHCTTNQPQKHIGHTLNLQCYVLKPIFPFKLFNIHSNKLRIYRKVNIIDFTITIPYVHTFFISKTSLMYKPCSILWSAHVLISPTHYMTKLHIPSKRKWEYCQQHNKKFLLPSIKAPFGTTLISLLLSRLTTMQCHDGTTFPTNST